MEAKCRKCDRVGHYGKVCRSKKDYKSGKEENNALMVEELYELQIGSVGDKVEGDTTRGDLGSGSCSSGSTLPGRPSKGKNNVLPHMVFNRKLGRYVAKKGGSAKMMDLQITLDKESFEILTPPGARIPSKSTMTSTPGTGDTGATICCTGVAMLDKLGIRRHHLLKTSVGLTVADKRVVTILEVVPVFITTRRAISKEGVHTRQLLYIVKELKGTFITREALEALE